MRIRIPLLLLLAALTASAHAQLFPYPFQKKTLATGLDVVVIEPPEFRGVRSFTTMILAGSWRATEKERTGLALLFKHIIVRHEHVPAEADEPAIERMGAFNNAFTWYDITYYLQL